jgi:hypothetical protein
MSGEHRRTSRTPTTAGGLHGLRAQPETATGKRNRALGLIAIASLGSAVLLLGWLMGAWTGPLKGDDVFFHAANVRFVAENFPHIWWFPNSHGGEPLMLSYPIAPYLLMAGLARLGLQLDVVFRLFLAASLIGIVIGLYFLARRLRLGRLLSFGIAFLPLTSHAFWSWSLVGGAYQRVGAIAFLILSILFCYRYIESRDTGRESRFAYFFLVSGVVLTALTHVLVFQFTIAIIVSILVLGLSGWKQRLQAIVKVSVPVAALVAWQYVPLVANVLMRDRLIPNAPRHDVATMRLEWLVGIPHPSEYTLGPGPILFLLSLAGFAYLVFGWPRVQEIRKNRRPLFALLLTSGTLSVFFIVFAWMEMPSGLYLMAAYDYAVWSSISLSVFGASFVSIVAQGRKCQGNWRAPALASLILMGTFSVVPWVRAFSGSSDPQDSDSYSSAAAQTARLGISMSEPSFRLGALNRTSTRLLSYLYPNLEYLGGRSSTSPHRYYYEWMVSETSYRLDPENVDAVYFEDRPRVPISDLALSDNYYPAMFWMDWYGTNTVLFDLPFYPQEETTRGYAARPNVFEYRSRGTKYGPVAAVSYPGSSAVATLSTAPVVAVPYLTGPQPSFYVDLLTVLSFLNLDSQTLIPVKLPTSEGLESFDRAIVDHSTYVAKRAELDRYVVRGGHLAVLGYRNSSVAGRAVQFRDELHITVESGLVPERAASSTFASSQDGPIGTCSTMGSGTKCILGVSLNALRDSADVAAALLLLEVIDVEYSLRTAQMAGEPRLTYLYPDTPAAIARPNLRSVSGSVDVRDWAVTFLGPNDSGEIERSSDGVRLVGGFSSEGDSDQANFTAYLKNEIPMASTAVVCFELKSEHRSNLALSFQKGRSFNVFNIKLTPGSMATYAIPVAAFQTGSGKVRHAKQLTFALKPSDAQLPRRFRGTSLVIRNLRVVTSAGTRDEKPVLLVGTVPGLTHHQANLGVRMKSASTVTRPGLITFRIFNRGATLTNLSVLLSHENPDKGEFLQYTFPPTGWSGYKSFTVPLGAFSRKETWRSPHFNRVDFAFNFDPNQQSPKNPFHELQVSDLKVITMQDASNSANLFGKWERPYRFHVSLPQNHPAVGFLWKENYSSEWLVRTSNDYRDHFFAGPGMIYVPLEQPTSFITLELPVPTTVVIGLLISSFLVLLLGLHWIFRRRPRQVYVSDAYGFRSPPKR